MSEALHRYYERELLFIRQLAQEFAKQYPGTAGRLLLEPNRSADPHVERLIESFALLAGRVHHKLDDEFPELTDALLGVLYPHYQTPVPSMAIVQFELDPAQNELTAGHTIPSGTMLETEAIQGEPCRFRTGYPTTLWPIELQSATLSKPPFQAPGSPRPSQAAAMLRLVLRCRSPGLSFSALA